jgi:hypothetical protein
MRHDGGRTRQRQREYKASVTTCSTHCLQIQQPGNYIFPAPTVPASIPAHAPRDPPQRLASPARHGLEPLLPLPACPAKAVTEYVGPMHPEVVRSEPGNCLICGMALEPAPPA